MVQIGEQQSVEETVETPQKETLLKKYDIPISHLDFTYINDCNNAKEIEQIVQILRSGEEGFYPDLLKCAENRLMILKPNSKYLKTTVPVLSKYDLPKSEWENLSSDIQSWVDNINKNDKELASFQAIKPPGHNLPIRKIKEDKKKPDKKAERIKSMDYDKWDKLDVDAEMLKMDLAEEKQKGEIHEEKNKVNTLVLDTDVMTKAELIHASEQARIAGNESFKLKDYEDALQYYTNSLMILPTASSYNNRAITNLKLEKYENSINDCNEVLKLEPFNEKALLRKAVALKHLQKYDKAIETLEKIIRINPNDTDSQKMIQTIRKKIGHDKPIKTVRLKIEDHIVDNSEKCNKKDYVPNKQPMEKPQSQLKYKSVLIPIQSTSSYIGPYYSIERLPIEIAEKFERNTKKTHTKCDDHVIDLNQIKQMKMNISHKKIVEINTEQNYFDDDDINYDFDPKNPYEFVKYWQAIKYDASLYKHEKLLRLMVQEECDIPTVLGNKMDGYMLTLIIKCLATRFRNANDVHYVAKILTELTKVPRFDIIMLLLSSSDRDILLDVLNRIYDVHGYADDIDANIYEIYYKYCQL